MLVVVCLELQSVNKKDMKIAGVGMGTDAVWMGWGWRWCSDGEVMTYDACMGWGWGQDL